MSNKRQRREQGDHTFSELLQLYCPSAVLRQSRNMPSSYGKSSASTMRKRYKKSMSRKYKSNPKITKVMETCRFVKQDIPVYLSTGFGSGGFDMGIGMTLSQAQFVIGGTGAYTPNVPAISEFTNLFDEYKIKKVEYEIFYSQANTNSGVNYPYPLLHIVNDKNSFSSFGLNDMQQYPTKKTYQLIPGQKIIWAVYPTARLDALTDNGITSTSAYEANGWIDTSASTVQFLGTRMYLDNQGRSTTNDVGTISVQLKYHLAFRYMR